ncbi:Hypothetical predicted protein [Olea europaea subsp. europaea]|uniref:Uncharacterized protein n=1 Tax=Olea europaea subsp. europaea TaxID=158383 RepID=A0A8S0SWB8_OLEEU|nr:Hypothetical predicted protein [Olea europaea subsp. europaea]
MPSGAKKRKAAKKKKENESSSNTSNQHLSTVHSHDDDSKNQDDKETDGGEVSSPASQDRHSYQQHFTEEEEEVEKGEHTSNFVFIEGVKNEGVNEQKIVVEEGSVVQVEKVLKHKDESEMKDDVVEHDELPEKSYDGGVSGSSSSSSNSSDDESHNFEKNKDTTHNASVDSAKAENSLSERPPEVIHGPLEEQAGDSIVQTCPVVGSEKVSLLNEEVKVNTSAPPDISEASYVSESVLKENGEKLKSAEENFVFSAGGMDAASDKEAVRASVQLAKNAAETSDAKECAVQVTDDKLTLSYSVTRVNDNNGAERQEDSQDPKPVVAHTLHPVQTTSWKNCCGLFELLTGSGR